MRLKLKTLVFIATQLLPLFGVFIAGTLTYSHFLGLSVTCGVSDACDIVNFSPASEVFHVPTALFGLVLYVILFGMSKAYQTTGFVRFLKLGMLLASTGSIVSLGLTIYSLKVLHALCLWCIASMFIIIILNICWSVVDRAQADANDFRWLNSDAFGILKWALVASYLGIPLMVHSDAVSGWNAVAASKVTRAEFLPAEVLSIADENPTRPDFVIFMSLKCPACHRLVKSLRQVTMQNSPHIVIRHAVHNPSEDAFKLAVLLDQATAKGKGLLFLDALLENDVYDVESARDIFKKLKIGSPTRTEEVEAISRVSRDASLCLKLGISEVPSIIRLSKEGPRLTKVNDFNLCYVSINVSTACD